MTAGRQGSGRGGGRLVVVFLFSFGAGVWGVSFSFSSGGGFKHDLLVPFKVSFCWMAEILGTLDEGSWSQL